MDQSYSYVTIYKLIYCEEMNSNEEEKNKKKPETMIYYTSSKGNMDCNRNAANEKTQLGTPFGSQH